MAKQSLNAKAERAFDAARLAYNAQDFAAAWDAAAYAARLAPDHAPSAFLKAQVAFESWRPSAALYEDALRLDPQNPDLVRNFILALAEEGQEARADGLLSGILARSPNWAEGHNLLIQIRRTYGHEEPYSALWDTCAKHPADATMHLLLFHAYARAQDWDKAGAVLKTAEALALNAGGIAAARAFFDCETGVAKGPLPATDEGFSDPGLALNYVRHALRSGAPELAAKQAMAWTTTPYAMQFWPYVDLSWRVLGDPRRDWLHGRATGGQGGFAEIRDMGLSPKECTNLAAFLHALHISRKAPYAEQSVKGGTQTARNLLFHHDPLIANLRRRFENEVRAWRANLPPAEPAHPFLGSIPDKLRFAGSWSVRLTAQGFHRAHTHPKGWASSAFYVTLPDDIGTGDSGKFALGTPPPELGLNLPPERLFTPVCGHLVLFPSHNWHATMPFNGAERLTIAFDVAPSPQNQGEIYD